MKAPRWRHRGTNGGYWKSVMAVVVVKVAEDMVAGCVVAMIVPAEVDGTEEGEGAADKIRR